MEFSAWGVELVNEWGSVFKGKHKGMIGILDSESGSLG